MPSQRVSLQGKVKWFRPDKVNPWNKFEHVLYLTDKSLETFRELQTSTDRIGGVKNALKKDDDGYHVRIARPSSREVKGKVVGMSPPMVFDKDGTTPLKGVFVGNGSDVTTVVEVYQYGVPGSDGKKGRAMRWEATRVDNLIPYTEPGAELLADELKQSQDTNATPAASTGYF